MPIGHFAKATQSTIDLDRESILNTWHGRPPGNAAIHPANADVHGYQVQSRRIFDLIVLESLKRPNHLLRMCLFQRLPLALEILCRV
jgi:hypothetical protein